jgi:hypothetical protein
MAIFTIDGYDSYSGCDIIVTAALPSINAEANEVYFTLGSLQTLSVSTHQDKRPVRSIGNINAKDYVMGQRTIAGSLVFAVFDRHFADKIMKQLGITMADEIPALDLTINFANEYGRRSRMAIYGVKLINEGQVMSINDLYTENTYQFVALGMEPLSVDDSKVVSKKDQGKQTEIISIQDDINEIITGDQFQQNSGTNLANGLRNNMYTSSDDTLLLTATIEQPVDNNDTGLVTLELNKVPPEGYIYITDLFTGDIVATIEIVNRRIATIELPIGYYNAQYMSKTRTLESNIEKLIIQVVVQDNIKIFDFYPIVEYVTDTSICVTVYNSAFSEVYCFESGKKGIKLNNTGKPILFKNLNSNTRYHIYAIGDNQVSNTTNVKTHKDKNTLYNKFIEYLTYNSNLLYNSFQALVDLLNSLLVNGLWLYNNILDGINKLTNDIIKQELLLYATMFENSMLQSYNYSNPYVLETEQKNIYDSTVLVNNWPQIRCYCDKNNKPVLENVYYNTNEIDCGCNKTYSLYGINNSTCSTKKNVVVLSNNPEDNIPTFNIDVYKTLDVTTYKLSNHELNNEDAYALAIKDNHHSDILLIDAPAVYIEDNVVYADVNYNFPLIDDLYYLCISDMYDTLDSVPQRKIAFNSNTKDIDLLEEYFPLDSNKIYHTWVENNRGLIISNTGVFNYKQSTGLERYLDKELKRVLNNKKALFNSIINNKTLLEMAITNLFSNSCALKNVNDYLELELLCLGNESKNVTNLLNDLLYPSVTMNLTGKLEINKLHYCWLIEDNLLIENKNMLDAYVVVKSYNLLAKEVDINYYRPNQAISIDNDFMTISLVSASSYKILAYMVLDCNTYKFKAQGFDVEVGD